jgi:hypothetical protein
LETAQSAGEAMREAFSDTGIGCTIIVSGIAATGARIVE